MIFFVGTLRTLKIMIFLGTLRTLRTLKIMIFDDFFRNAEDAEGYD
jgi:hypothetical protein